MDKSLDEIISDRYQSTRGRYRGNSTRGNYGGHARGGGISKGPYSRQNFRNNNQRQRHYSNPDLANTIKISNLHYELSEDDIYELLTRVGSVRRVNLQYDRSGRSDGVAYANFEYATDAEEAVRQFDGKKAAGIEISVKLLDESAQLRNRLSFHNDSDNNDLIGNSIDGSSGNGDLEGASEGGSGSGFRQYNRYHNQGQDNGPRKLHGYNNRYDRGRGGKRFSGGNSIRQPRKTLEELDNELDSYMNGTDSTTTNTSAVESNDAVEAETK